MRTTDQKESLLYITYDGILEPLGQSQVLSYLENLSSQFEVHLVSYEKNSDIKNLQLVQLISERVKSAGISWTPLKYHKSFSILSTSWDLIVGLLVCVKIVISNKIMLVHARSYVPSIIALLIKKILKTYFIFDMRGFWADERVDGGLWKKNGSLYNVAKWFERKFLLNADHIVSLTHAGITAMKQFPYLINNIPPHSVIPTCADLKHFTVKPNKNKSFTLGYVGSVGLWYDFDATLLCFNELLKVKKDSNLLIINKNEHEFIYRKIKEHEIPLEHIKIISASFQEIPKYINSMDAGIFFIKPYFSKQASAPTKLAELYPNTLSRAYGWQRLSLATR